jgi:uncharacterized membrane protein
LLLERNLTTEHEFDDHVVAKLAASGGRLLKTNLKVSLEIKLQLALEVARHRAHGVATTGVHSAAG